MALCLHRLGRMEEAVRLAEDERPAIFVSRELLLAQVAPPEQARRIRESNTELLAGYLAGTLKKLGREDDAQAIQALCQP